MVLFFMLMKGQVEAIKVTSSREIKSMPSPQAENMEGGYQLFSSFFSKCQSGRREFHPPALTEPCGILSHHTAPILKPCYIGIRTKSMDNFYIIS